ncbi:hypothetical protein C0J52_02155 [Blattella germanica]|nr:hypothetical protein C0J52_02155 [Blattella germanica]
MRYSQLRRHNDVVNRVKKAAQSKYTVLAENEAMVGTLRPGLVIVRNGSATVIDVTIPFENRLEALAEARRVKCEKYQPLAEALSTRFTNVSVEALVVGSLGSWDKGNDTLMKNMCSRSYCIYQYSRSYVSRTSLNIPETYTWSTSPRFDNSAGLLIAVFTWFSQS